MKNKLISVLFALLPIMLPAICSAQQGQYMSLDTFLNSTFLPSEELSFKEAKNGLSVDAQEIKTPYRASTLWLVEEQKKVIKNILGHEYNGFRIRYWYDDEKTAWVLEEIGKEHPITMGVVIADQKISQFSILEFRESRGWEIKYDFFTQQFLGAVLKINKKNELELSQSIDGITGATLSVRATQKIAKLALYLDQQVNRIESSHGANPSTY